MDRRQPETALGLEEALKKEKIHTIYLHKAW